LQFQIAFLWRSLRWLRFFLKTAKHANLGKTGKNN